MDPQLQGNPIKRRFRLKWPWEQDRQMSVYNVSKDYIQVASQHIHIHIHIYVHIYTYTYKHSCIYMHVYIHIYT